MIKENAGNSCHRIGTSNCDLLFVEKYRAVIVVINVESVILLQHYNPWSLCNPCQMCPNFWGDYYLLLLNIRYYVQLFVVT